MRRVIIIASFFALVRAQADNPDIQNAIDTLFSNSSFLENYEEVTSPPLGSLGALEKCGEGTQRNVFVCVPYYNCDRVTNTVRFDSSTDGSNVIDIRAPEDDGRTCDHYLDVCCRSSDENGNLVTPPPTRPPTRPPTNGGTPITNRPTDNPFTTGPIIPTPRPNPVRPGEDTTSNSSRQSFCGIRRPNGLDFSITGNTNEAEFGEFPWMVAVLTRTQSQSVCGGSLIAPNVVLTGAHCVSRLNPADVIIRAGEWDTQTTKERIPYQERNVARIISHEFFNAKTVYNDVALLILERPLSRADNIGTVCLPSQDQHFNSRDCFATGWGKNKFGSDGAYSVILKKIQLPLVQNAQCQQALRTTRLGQSFILHKSFICAGGEAGKDTCTGDGGSPLVCPDPNNPNRYMQVGIVAWGIGCGETQVPGVYVDVAQFRTWIQNNLQRLQISNDPFTRASDL